MKILYLSGSYVPSRRASSIHVMRMCQAMAQQGHDVTLVTKDNSETTEPGVTDDYEFYGVDNNFSILKLPRPNRQGGGIRFTWEMNRLLSAFHTDGTLVYSRELFGAWLAARKGFRVVFEDHTLPVSWFSRWLHKQLFDSPNFCRFVVISQALKELFAAEDLMPDLEKVLIAHDAADPISPSRGHPNGVFQEDGKIQLGYVGQLYDGKGLEIIFQLANKIPNINLHIVGGNEKDLNYWQKQNPPQNVFFHGFVNPGDLPYYFSNFDIFLMPYQKKVYVAGGKTDTARWMSPLKMFEYMAAGKPIISSDLPVLREVLVDEENALLVPPDDVNSWQAAVLRLSSDPELAQRIGRQAHQDFLDKYTWTARAQKVLQKL